jgi:uncharacterized membrane protein YhaH (DUF805 family)
VRLVSFLFSFEGRISRESYWLFFGACLVLSIALQVAVGAPNESEAMIFWLILLWPALAVIVKRYHDCDRSSGWVLVHFLIPPLGIYQCGFLRGTPGINRFGPDHSANNSAAAPKRKWLCLLAATALFFVGFFFLSSVLLVPNFDLAERFWGVIFGIAAWWAAYSYLRRGLTGRLTPGRTDGPKA